jgi:hypothetical protein
MLPSARRSRLTLPAAALVAAIVAALLLLPAAASGSPAGAKPKQSYPRRYILTNSTIGHWATVLHTVAAHKLPSKGSPTVTMLSPVTGDGTQNIVLILAGLDVAKGQTWYKVRLAVLPNNSTAWLPQSALGNLYAVYTHLYVSREAFTATLKRNGKTIFTTRVGVGKTAPGWGPTPAGQFYVRDKLIQPFSNPFYGPYAFGTSARSAVLTEWPGGGYIGIHGTDEPQLIPGYISHGCIRMHNDAITRLWHLMQVGTPITIT